MGTPFTPGVLGRRNLCNLSAKNSEFWWFWEFKFGVLVNVFMCEKILIGILSFSVLQNAYLLNWYFWWPIVGSD